MANTPSDEIAELLIIKDHKHLDSIRLESELINIGRSLDELDQPYLIETGKISLRDPAVQRIHAKISRDEQGRYWLHNVSDVRIHFSSSAKDTLLPKEKLALVDQSVFGIGKFQLKFILKAARLDDAFKKRGNYFPLDDSDDWPITYQRPVDDPHLKTSQRRSEDVEFVDTNARDADFSRAVPTKMEHGQRSESPTPPIPTKAPTASAEAQSSTDKSARSPKSPVPPTATPAPPTPEIKPERLPNGIVGSAYRSELSTFFPTKSKNFDSKFSSNIGLEFNIEEGKAVVSGVPTLAGQHLLTIRHDEPEKPGRVTEFEIFLNPDPRSLWKNLPTDPSLPYQKSTSAFDVKTAPDMTLIAASVRGRSHAHEGTFRDDDFILAQQDGWYLIAVSDGAGSAKYSRKGSEIACITVREETFKSIEALDVILSRQPSSGIQAEAKQSIAAELYSVFGKAGKSAFENIVSEASQPSEEYVKSAKLNDFAATLIYCTYKKFAFGWFVAAFAVGDGGVAVYSRDNPVEILNKADGGEYAGQTRFATMPHIWESEEEIRTRIQVRVVNNFTAVVAMTDGVSDPKFGTDKNFGDTEYWHRLWDELSATVDFTGPAAGKTLLEWLDFWSAGNHDDRTIALGLPTNE